MRILHFEGETCPALLEQELPIQVDGPQNLTNVVFGFADADIAGREVGKGEQVVHEVRQVPGRRHRGFGYALVRPVEPRSEKLRRPEDHGQRRAKLVADEARISPRAPWSRSVSRSSPDCALWRSSVSATMRARLSSIAIAAGSGRSRPT